MTWMHAPPRAFLFAQLLATVVVMVWAGRHFYIRAWKGLGYNLRALRLHSMAQTLGERFRYRLPKDLDQLLSIKGIGPYTARALLRKASKEEREAFERRYGLDWDF